MEAGKELDALVAERVMGWTVNRPGDRHWHALGGGLGGRQVGSDCCEDRYDYGRAFRPSQDIRSAWEVVEKLAGVGDGQSIWIDGLGFTGEEWRVVIGREVGEYVVAEADTAPLAICRAVLKATPTTNSASSNPEESGK